MQEVAFTLAERDRLRAGGAGRGPGVDEFAPRLAFFFNAHNNVFQEVAKFRAARRMWARIMRERFGARDERSMMLRFHTQTGGVTLTAQQPLQQRRARRAAGVRGGLRRHAVAAHQRLRRGARAAHGAGGEARAAHPAGDRARVRASTDTVDPFAGSYFVEALTDEIERRASALIAHGRRARRLGRGDRLHHRRDRRIRVELPGALPHRPGHRRRRQRLHRGRRAPDRDACASTPPPKRTRSRACTHSKPPATRKRSRARSTALRETAQGTETSCTPIREALRHGATIGEICGAMREIFGSHRARD